ncbi:Protein DETOXIFICATION [Arachis hypogaea]|nr:Protein DETOXIFICATION [Arachis hypogaea]
MGKEEINEKLLQKDSSVGKRVWKESKKMWVVAGPAIMSRFSTFGITVVSQSFIGHIGSTDLAAYALVMTLLVKFANGVLLGMASALETLCGQAYGAKKYEMLGIYLQRSWIILFMTSLLLLPIFIFTAPLLKFLGQEKTIAEVAGSISLWSILVVFSFLFLLCFFPCLDTKKKFTCQMFLQAQSKNKIIAYLAALSISTHIFLSWLLTVRYKLGLNGAMISTLVYIMRNCPQTWKGFSFLAFKDLRPLVKLSLSSGAMMCLEIWYSAVLILLTGNMKNAEVYIDALSICLNINGWEMVIALGFFAAAGVRVANELGRGSSEGAKFSIVVTAVTSFCIGIVLFFVFLLLRERVAYVFTPNPMVAEAVGELSPLLAFSIFLNSLQPVLSGVSVGAGWQSVVAYVNIGCYYLIGIPVGVLLGNFLHLKIKGIWIGMLFGTVVQTIMLITITMKTDWDKQVEIARNRVNKWTIIEENEEPCNSS